MLVTYIRSCKEVADSNDFEMIKNNMSEKRITRRWARRGRRRKGNLSGAYWRKC